MFGNTFAAKAQSGSSNEKKDVDDFFCEMISQKLKQFSARKKAYLNYQIQRLINDSQMEISELANSLMSQPPVANQSNTNIYGSPVFYKNHRENPKFGYYTNFLKDYIDVFGIDFDRKKTNLYS